MGAVAGVGLLVFIVGLCCMYWWKCWDKTATYLMIIGGLCLAAAGAGPLVKVSSMISSGADQAAGWFGAAGVGLTIVTVILALHVGRALWPKGERGGGVQIKKSHQWAGFFAPGLFIAAGGVAAIAANLATAAQTAGDQLSTFIGG